MDSDYMARGECARPVDCDRGAHLARGAPTRAALCLLSARFPPPDAKRAPGPKWQRL